VGTRDKLHENEYRGVTEGDKGRKKKKPGKHGKKTPDRRTEEERVGKGGKEK